jgi:hypothetical protein
VDAGGRRRRDGDGKTKRGSGEIGSDLLCGEPTPLHVAPSRAVFSMVRGIRFEPHMAVADRLQEHQTSPVIYVVQLPWRSEYQPRARGRWQRKLYARPLIIHLTLRPEMGLRANDPQVAPLPAGSPEMLNAGTVLIRTQRRLHALPAGVLGRVVGCRCRSPTGRWCGRPVDRP